MHKIVMAALFLCSLLAAANLAVAMTVPDAGRDVATTAKRAAPIVLCARGRRVGCTEEEKNRGACVPCDE